MKDKLNSGGGGYTKESLYEALGKAETGAIVFLEKKIAYDIRQMGSRGGLSREDVEEVINDALVVTISSIRKGKFQFMDYHPAAYAKGVARKLIANRARKKRLPTEVLEPALVGESDFSPEQYLRDKERQRVVEDLLGRLGPKCRKLLRLKFFDHLRDEEILNRGLTPYGNLSSLRSKRSQCLKKLTQIARETGVRKLI